MPFIFSKKKKNNNDKIKRRFYELIGPHLSVFQRIIKSGIRSYPRFNRYYEVDDNPNLNISDFSVGCSMTFTNSWDTSKDSCTSEILDPSVIDKIFEMEDKIVKELQEYCDRNKIPVTFSTDKSRWDDAGIYCSIDISYLSNIANESGIFENVIFI